MCSRDFQSPGVSSKSGCSQFNLEFLFQVIYESVIAGTNDDEILSICAEHCTLNQYEFVRYALEYIHLNRMPSQWEQNNVYHKMIEIVNISPIESLFEYIESIKNIRNRSQDKKRYSQKWVTEVVD
ncbi:MAG: hypothetical protein V7L23_24280 [Nostoc sp.]|uniref:hypothetical protein n=1 Tax=Nostoc sp. TaxID=1180 RepID=UPI002FEF648F